MNKQTITFTNKRGIRLVGDFYKANSNKGIIMCHGFTGDRHEGGKYDLLAQRLQQEGYNALNFDFSGSGESEDEPLNTNNQAEDFKEAIDYMKTRGITTFGTVGMSLGPLAILKNKSLLGTTIKAAVLWCPVTKHKKDYLKERFTTEQQEQLKKEGIITYTKIKPGRPRQTFTISKQLLKERETINQEELLQGINIPLLIIHGEEDETIPVTWSQEALTYLPEGSELQTITETGHTFKGKEEETINKTTSWLTKHL